MARAHSSYPAGWIAVALILVLLATGVVRSAASVSMDLRHTTLRTAAGKTDLVALKSESCRLNLAPSTQAQKKVGLPFAHAPAVPTRPIRVATASPRRATGPTQAPHDRIVGVVELRI